MADMHHVKLINDKPHGIHGRLELDGEDVHPRAVTVRVDAQEVNTVTLDLFVDEITVEVEGRVDVSEQDQAILKRLGWTPPEETP